MKKSIYNSLQFLAFLGTGAFILFLVYQYQNAAFLEECSHRDIPEAECSLIGKLVDDFRGADFFWINLVLLSFLISNVSRTIKWNMLLKPLGYKPRFINSFLSILVGYFANLGLPRMGEVIRAGVISKYENMQPEKVMGTIVVDRIVDVLCLGLAFLLALFFEYQKLWAFFTEKPEIAGAERNYNWLWISVMVLMIMAGLVLVFYKKIIRIPLFGKVLNLLKGLWEGVLSVRQLEKPWLFIFHSLNIWILYFLMTWLGFKAFGPTAHLGLEAALTVFVFGSLGVVIPSPGGMGTFHALVIISLTMFYGINGNDAFSVANIIFFSVSIGFNIILGLSSLILLPLINRRT